MQRNEQWKGLVSKASPYLLEPGATQEQVNLHNKTPGQLEVREGMSAVTFTQEMTHSVLDLASYRTSNQHILLLLNTSGNLIASTQPLIQPSIKNGYEPPCSVSDGQTTTNYLWQYATDDGVTKDLIYVWNGGIPKQTSWQYKVDAEGGIGPSVDAGGASITTLDGVDPDEMTEYS
jgi:hypothetical protein